MKIVAILMSESQIVDTMNSGFFQNLTRCRSLVWELGEDREEISTEVATRVRCNDKYPRLQSEVVARPRRSILDSSPQATSAF